MGRSIGKEGWNTELEEIGAKGICGSGIIDVVPQLYGADIVTEFVEVKRPSQSRK